MESLPADKAANLRTIERFVEQAAAQGARLVLFPECCITGYWFMRNLSVAQLAELAQKTDQDVDAIQQKLAGVLGSPAVNPNVAVMPAQAA